MTALDRLTGGYDTARVTTPATPAEQAARDQLATAAAIYFVRGGHHDLHDILGLTGPRRIQLRRTPGWTLPADTTVVGGHTRWANPYKPGRDGIPDHAAALAQFRRMLGHHLAGQSGWPDYPTLTDIRAQLGGRNLACWCPLPELPGQPDVCHAATLLALANPVERP